MSSIPNTNYYSLRTGNERHIIHQTLNVFFVALFLTLSVLILSGMGVIGIAHAQELNENLFDSLTDSLTADMAVGFYSDYLTRGRLRDLGPSVQPSLSVTKENSNDSAFSFNLWAHVPAGNSEISKIEPSIRYDISVAAITASLGHTWHIFPTDMDDNENDENDSVEFFAGIAFDTILSPQFVVNYDYRSYNAWFVETLLSHRFTYDWGFPFALVPNVSFGWSLGDDERYERDGFSYGGYGVLAEIPIGEFQIIPTVQYNQKSDGMTANRWWAGAAIAYSFGSSPIRVEK